jgi:hypothetical protein
MEFKSFMEVLKGKQHKIDKNKNGKIDAHDFKLLQKEETEELDEASVKSEKHSWGKMMTVHHGASHSYPLHPEHQEAIRNLKHGEKTSFKDETGAKVNVHRDVQDVHFTSNKTSTKTTVPHSHFSEEVEHIYEVNHRELASVGKMHPQMAKYMTKGHEMDFYAQGSGDKISGVVKHNNGKEVHVQANKNGKLGGGLVHKFKVSSVHEETAPWETEAEAKARKASSNFKKPSNPNRTGMDTARALAQKAMKQKMKEEFGLDITDEQADSLLEMSHAPVAPVPDRKYIKGTPENKALKASRKPINGMPTNVKEEAEQIDELSKGTLGSYIKKAKGSAIGSSQVMGMGSSMTGQKSQDKAEKNVQKRATGINKAVDRLTKEDIDFNDEGTLMTKTVSYKEFLEINEIKMSDLPSRIVRGTSYGANYSDPEGSDDYDDKKPVKAAPEKRGRGRPSGAQSGARKNLGNSKLHTK